jgi:L-threonylcarbamoyladenylate synthase
MEILQIGAKKDFGKIIKIFSEGGVVVLPTDTIYGLSCLIDKKDSVESIYKIKKRPKNRRFIVLVSDIKMLQAFFNISSQQIDFLEDFLKKEERPTSFILNPKKNIKKWLNIKDGGVAVRLPKNKFLIKIIKELDVPIISTSCNLSNQESINEVGRIISFFKEIKIFPDLIVRRGSFFRSKRNPSRIIDIRDINNVKIIR